MSEMNGMTSMDRYALLHYGVKGMKWGRRRSDAELARARGSDDHESTVATRTKGKTEGIRSLSNKEIESAIRRMNLEQQYSKMTMSEGQRAVAFVGNMMQNFGKQTVNAMFNTKLRKVVSGGGSGPRINTQMGRDGKPIIDI